MAGVKIALFCRDEQVVASIKRELDDVLFNLALDSADAAGANLALVDCRSGVKPVGAPRLPYIAILEKAADYPGLREALDYVLYPFQREDLAYRVRRCCDQFLHCKDEEGLKIDLNNFTVIADGELLNLTFKEFLLLRFLVESKGRAVARDQLLKKIWGRDYEDGNRTIDVHIRRLRAKLGIKYGGLIQTVKFVGYRFCSDTSVHISEDRSGC